MFTLPTPLVIVTDPDGATMPGIATGHAPGDAAALTVTAFPAGRIAFLSGVYPAGTPGIGYRWTVAEIGLGEWVTSSDLGDHEAPTPEPARKRGTDGRFAPRSAGE